MGLLAAILVVLWRESRDRRLRLDQDVPELLEQPLLGLISHDKRSTPLLLLSHR
jgi:capsular polysaccharide biosynthesis protein